MLLKPDPLLWAVIKHRRIIRLLYHGKDRVVEPHDHGMLNGSVQLLGYQIAGSSSRPLPNWILMKGACDARGPGFKSGRPDQLIQSVGGIFRPRGERL